MNRSWILLTLFVFAPALLAQTAPDTLWTKVLWDAPGASAKAAVEVDGGYIIACNRGQEVHLCKIDDAGNVVWSKWYGAELRGIISNHRIALRNDGCLLFALLTDSVAAACVSTTGEVCWRRSCGVSSYSWFNEGGQGGRFTTAIATLLPAGFVHVLKFWSIDYHAGYFRSCYFDSRDSTCNTGSLSGFLPSNWYFAICRDFWVGSGKWAYATATGEDSVGLAMPGFAKTYYMPGVDWAHITPASHEGIYLAAGGSSAQTQVLRIADDGQFSWTRSMGIMSASFSGVEAVLDDGCILAGTFHTEATGNDIFLFRLGHQGDSLWTGYYGTSADESANDVVFSTRSGGFVLAGQIALNDTIHPYVVCTQPDTAYWYVDIADFITTANDSGVEITFNVSTELNVDHYELLRSVSGFYHSIGTIPAGGTQAGHPQYRCVDHLAGGHLQYTIVDVGRNNQRREHPDLIASISREPTQVSAFAAREDSGRVLLTMQTAFEFGVDHYSVKRRSSTGIVFITTMPSRGNSYNGTTYLAEDHDYDADQQFIYYSAAIDSSGFEWTFSEMSDTILTRNPPSPPTTVFPQEYTLIPFPNPFNSNTTLYFYTSRTENVRINIYDLTGRFVKTVVNREYTPGGWTVPFNAADLPSGIYFARINTAAGFTKTQKLLLVR